MAGKLLTIDADTAALLAAMDQLGRSEIEQRTKPRAKATADRVAFDAAARVARRTGATAQGIHVEEARDGVGYVVLAADVRLRPMVISGLGPLQAATKHIPQWLEFGTVHMTARPFFFEAARLNEAAHERSMREGIQEAIDAMGLGA